MFMFCPLQVCNAVWKADCDPKQVNQDVRDEAILHEDEVSRSPDRTQKLLIVFYEELVFHHP